MIFSANSVTWLIFWRKISFKKYYNLPIMPLFIGEESVSNATEFKLLCLLRPVLSNELVSFHEIHVIGKLVCDLVSSWMEVQKQANSRALRKICYKKKESILEEAIKRHSSKKVYYKMLLFFIIVVLNFWPKLNFSKDQGFQPQMHNSSFVEHFWQLLPAF